MWTACAFAQLAPPPSGGLQLLGDQLFIRSGYSHLSFGKHGQMLAAEQLGGLEMVVSSHDKLKTT